MPTADVLTPPAQRSFRDPAGTVYRLPGRILRAVHSPFVKDLEDFLATGAAQRAIEEGRLVRSNRQSPLCNNLWEHNLIPFPSFPYEWPREMLHAAAALTLDLAEAALEDGFGLKDATPYNVLFHGSRPVFVDVLSFERRDPLDSTWMAYAQFVRTFLLPLLAQRYFDLPLDRTLTGQRDGIEPETIYRWAGMWRRLTPPFLSLVTLPNWLGSPGDGEGYRRKRAASPEQARFVLSGLLRQCRRQLNSLAPVSGGNSTWSGYLDHKSLYSEAQLEQKEAFVRDALALARPQTAPYSVLDVGANEGRFSVLAARQRRGCCSDRFRPGGHGHALAHLFQGKSGHITVGSGPSPSHAGGRVA